MTITILNEARNSEFLNAEEFIATLLESEPGLRDPNIRFSLIVSANLPGRQLDLICIYEDNRPPSLRFRNRKNARIDSFVMVVEVKRHSSDHIKFEGNRLLVRYGTGWHDASDQSESQKYAFKELQQASYYQDRKRTPTFIHNALWLPRAEALNQQICAKPPVYFNDLSWQKLIDDLDIRKIKEGIHYTYAVKTLVSVENSAKNHSFDSLVEILTKEVVPTKLDKERIRRLNQERFDADKTQYIQNLGNGLLMLKGRGGTGKTFSLLQLALHLSKKGSKTLILTFNHGLISDISRTLRILKETWPEEKPLPEIMTRYQFIKRIYMSNSREKIFQGPDIEENERNRTNFLLEEMGEIYSPWDFVLIDEGQDWQDIHRDLVFKVFGAEKVIVAHGVDQFVSGDRCEWDLEEIPINRRHGLRVSRRTKGATCATISHLAKRLGVKDWDLEPDPEIYGGRLTVLVEPSGPKAMQKALALLRDDYSSPEDIQPVDNLLCLPDSKSSAGINYPALFDKYIREFEMESWRGFDPDDRRIYPYQNSQLRSVLYQSCRGMEGWTTVCMGLDKFYESQFEQFRVNERDLEIGLRLQHGLLFESDMIRQKTAELKKQHANQWIMIPLTRSIDHLIIHLSNPDSYLSLHLREISDKLSGSINWIE